MTQTILFEELIKLKIDNRGKTPPIADKGYPLLEVNAISKNKLYPDISKVNKFVNQETYSSWFRQHLEQGDILFTTVGTVAESAIIPDNISIKMTIAQNILGFRFEEELIEPLYALYLMRSRWFLNQIGGRTIETVQKSIKWSDMRGIKIELSDLETQKKIADILGTIDEKIELNRRMNETLEQMGQALFRHYFIDNPEAEKWKNGVVSDLFEVNMGQSPPGSSYNENDEGVTFYQGRAEFGARFPVKRLSTIDPKRLAKAKDVLLSVRAPVGDINQATEDCCIGRGLAAISSKNGMTSFCYYSCKKLQSKLTEYNSEGTVFGAINGKQLNALKIKLPTDNVTEAFEEQASELDEQILYNSKQIQTLTTLRDTLLPRLINGKVKV